MKVTVQLAHLSAGVAHKVGFSRSNGGLHFPLVAVRAFLGLHVTRTVFLEIMTIGEAPPTLRAHKRLHVTAGLHLRAEDEISTARSDWYSRFWDWDLDWAYLCLEKRCCLWVVYSHPVLSPVHTHTRTHTHTHTHAHTHTSHTHTHITHTHTHTHTHTLKTSTRLSHTNSTVEQRQAFAR